MFLLGLLFFEVGLLTEHRAHGQGTLVSACFTPSALELRHCAAVPSYKCLVTLENYGFHFFPQILLSFSLKPPTVKNVPVASNTPTVSDVEIDCKL